MTVNESLLQVCPNLYKLRVGTYYWKCQLQVVLEMSAMDLKVLLSQLIQLRLVKKTARGYYIVREVK
jgi:hypothetical protein